MQSSLHYFLTPLQVDRRILFPNEKIGFVIAVLLIILVSIALLLIRMDRRLSRLEQNQRSADVGHKRP